MNWIIGIFAVALIAIFGSYWLTGMMQSALTLNVREDLVSSGQAHTFAQLPSGATHYRLEQPAAGSSAPLIVLVHGYSTPSFVYDGYFEALTGAGYQVLSFDLYGRGFSDRPTGSYGVTRYVEQLSELLYHLRAEAPVHLVGYSMGGPIVTQFANSFEARVASVSLIAPAGLATPEGQGSTVMFAPVLGEWIFRVLGASVLRQRFSDGFDYAPDPVTFEANFARQFDYRGLDHALLDTIRAFGRGEFNVDYAAVGAANIPVQAFFAENDRVIPIVSAERLEAVNPQADIHRFEDGDHAIGYGKADEIAANIIAFVERD